MSELNVVIDEMTFSEPDNQSNFNGDGDVIKACTFEKLIEKVTHPSIRQQLLFEFLLTYRSICDSQTLLNAVIRRFFTAEGEKESLIRLRSLNLIRTWISKHWFDFSRDKHILVPIFEQFKEDVIRDLPSMEKPLLDLAQKLDETLESNLSEREYTFASPPPKPILPQNIQGFLKIVDLDPVECARQLTLIEAEIWRSIQPWECIGQAWTKRNKDVIAANIIDMVARFNEVSNWVSTVIVTTEDSRDRVNMIKMFIDVAWELKELNNFNGILEVVSGLNSASCHRLSSMSQIPKDYNRRFEEMKAIVSRNNNYEVLRQTLHSLQPPCIPYLGMYLTDLTFIEEGHKDFNSNGLLNFLKRHQIARVISEIKQYQDVAYNLKEITFVQEYLRNLNYFDEDSIYNCSLYVEPREGKPKGERPVALENYLENLQDEKTEFDVVYPPGYRYTEKDGPKNVRFLQRSGTKIVVQGTLEKLVERVTFEKYIETAFLGHFLNTYRSFSTPGELLSLLKQRYFIPPLRNPNQKNEADYLDKKERPVQLRVFNCLKSWIDRHFYDFQEDEELLQELLVFIDFIGQNNDKFAALLKTNIDKLLNAGHSESEQNYPPSIGPKINKAPQDCSSMDFDPEEIARQLCLIDHELLCLIRPAELIDENHSKPDFMGYSHNYHRLKNRIGDISYLIQHEIFSVRDSGKKLQHIIKWLTVMDHLVNFNSLNSLKGVLDGLNVTQEVDQQAWNMVPGDQKQQFTTLWKQYDPVNGFHMIRDRMKKSPPSIPYLPLFAEDLASLEKEHLNIVNRLINFQKHIIVSEFLNSGLLEYQKFKYNFSKVPVIREWLTLERGPPQPDFLRMEDSLNSIPPPKIEILNIASHSASHVIPDHEEVLFLIREDENVRKALKNTIRGEIRKLVRKVVDTELPPIDMRAIRKQYFDDMERQEHIIKDINGLLGQEGANVTLSTFEDDTTVIIYTSTPVVTLANIYRMLKLGQLYKENNIFENRRLGSIFMARDIDPEARQVAVQTGIDFILCERDV